MRRIRDQLSDSPSARAWLGSRLVVLAALLTAWLIPGHRHAGLLAWDGYWYDTIAKHGYLGSPAGAIRFFPALPLLARWSAALVSAPPGVLLVVIANAASLLSFALAKRVAAEVRLSPAATRLVPAVVAYAPAGFVLVMGYTEALFGVLLAVVLLGVRREQWLCCAGAGLLAGALRPTGVLLCLPIAMEAGRGLRTATPAGVAARVVALCAPVAGLGLFLGWSWHAYGDPLAPFHAQTGPDLRGGVIVDPVVTLASAVHAVVAGKPNAVLLHLFWIGVSLGLLVVSARKLPASYTAFAAATLFLAVTAQNFSSYERYACSALPLLLAAALVLADRRRLRVVAAVLAPAVLFGHALYAFLAGYVP